MQTIPTRVVLPGRIAASPDLTTTPRAWGRESRPAAQVLSTPHNETARRTHHAHASAISADVARGTAFRPNARLLGRSALDVVPSSATLEWRTRGGSAPAEHQSQREADPDHPCDMFSPGKPTNGGCQGDGHYLCGKCALLEMREPLTDSTGCDV